MQFLILNAVLIMAIVGSFYIKERYMDKHINKSMSNIIWAFLFVCYSFAVNCSAVKLLNHSDSIFIVFSVFAIILYCVYITYKKEELVSDIKSRLSKHISCFALDIVILGVLLPSLYLIEFLAKTLFFTSFYINGVIVFIVILELLLLWMWYWLSNSIINLYNIIFTLVFGLIHAFITSVAGSVLPVAVLHVIYFICDYIYVFKKSKMKDY